MFSFHDLHYAGYEEQKNIPKGTIAKAILSSYKGGAWAALERGEISMEEFGQQFTEECSTVVRRNSFVEIHF